MFLPSCGQWFELVNFLWNSSSCYLAANPLCVLLLCAVLGLPVELAERRSCCHGKFESSHCFPLCQQLWRNGTHWSKFFLGCNCSAVQRCLADVEAGTAAEVDKRGRFAFPCPKHYQSSQVTQGRFGNSWVPGVVGQSCSSPRACASPAVSRRRFSKEFSIAIEIGKCENEKLFCKRSAWAGCRVDIYVFQKFLWVVALLYTMKKLT